MQFELVMHPNSFFYLIIVAQKDSCKFRKIKLDAELKEKLIKRKRREEGRMRATNDDKNVIDELDDGKEVAVVDE